MKKLIILFSVLITILLFCCKKETLNHDSIIGQWEWIMTSSDDFGFPKTPESVDSTFYVEFNKNGQHILRDNSKNQILVQGYKLGQTGQFKTLEIIGIEFVISIYYYSISNDTLSIWIPNQLRTTTTYFSRI
jgi:hypothetical protein